MADLTTPRSLPESSSDSEASIHSSDSDDSDEEPIPSRPSFDGSPTNVSASDDDMFVQVEYEEEREDPLDEQSASTAPNMDEDLLDPDWATLPSSVEACWEVLRHILVGYELVRPDAKGHVVQEVEQILSTAGLTWQSFGKEQLARMRSKTDASVEGQCVYYRGFDMKSHYYVLALADFYSEHWKNKEKKNTIKTKRKKSAKSSVASIYKRRLNKMDMKRRYTAKYRISHVRYWGSIKHSSVERHQKDVNLGQDAAAWPFVCHFLNEASNLERLNSAAKKLAQGGSTSSSPSEACPQQQSPFALTIYTFLLAPVRLLVSA